jgi:hypothetical protein
MIIFNCKIMRVIDTERLKRHCPKENCKLNYFIHVRLMPAAVTN